MRWLSRTFPGGAPVAESAVELPQIPLETCTACHVGTEDMTFINLPGVDGQVPVCSNPAHCRQRAQLLGIYLGGRR